MYTCLTMKWFLSVRDGIVSHIIFLINQIYSRKFNEVYFIRKRILLSEDIKKFYQANQCWVNLMKVINFLDPSLLSKLLN
jgi:hypothetical protein